MTMIVTAVLTVLPAEATVERDPLDWATGQANGSYLDLVAQARSAHESADRGSSSDSESVAATRPPQQISTLVPACPGNDPNEPGGGPNGVCTSATLGCPVETEVRYARWVAPVGPEGNRTGDWVRGGEVCAGPGAEDDPAPVVVPAFTLQDLQRLPLQPAPKTVQPGGNRTLINFPTNVYVEPTTATFDTDLLGFPVQVRATPVRFTYDFGDGTVIGPTTDPGAPAPPDVELAPVGEPTPGLRIHHEYSEDSDFAITVTTHYSAQYSIDGGPFQPVVGEATVTDEPYPVEILTSTPRLVADTLDDCPPGPFVCSNW